jgi:hypothetical protein
MEQIECSETSAYKIQKPGNYPEENIQCTEHGESLKSSRSLFTYLPMKMEQSVPKRRHIEFRRRGITQKKTYNIQDTTKLIVALRNFAKVPKKNALQNSKQGMELKVNQKKILREMQKELSDVDDGGTFSLVGAGSYSNRVLRKCWLDAHRARYWLVINELRAFYREGGGAYLSPAAIRIIR